MRYYQERQYEMIRMVTEFLKKQNDKLCIRVPAYKKSIPLLIAKQKELFDLKTGIVHAVALKTGEKQEVRILLINAILKLLSAIEADPPLADDNKNTDADDSEYSVRKLQRATAEDLSKIGTKIIQSAKKIKNIRQYGLFPGDIGDALAYLEEFNKTKDVPLKRKTEVAEQNKNIDLAIKNCMLLLEKKIDPLMRMVAESDKALSDSYKATRKVLPRGQGRISEREEKVSEEQEEENDEEEGK